MKSPFQDLNFGTDNLKLYQEISENDLVKNVNPSAQKEVIKQKKHALKSLSPELKQKMKYNFNQIGKKHGLLPQIREPDKGSKDQKLEFEGGIMGSACFQQLQKNQPNNLQNNNSDIFPQKHQNLIKQMFGLKNSTLQDKDVCNFTGIYSQQDLDQSHYQIQSNSSGITNAFVKKKQKLADSSLDLSRFWKKEIDTPESQPKKVLDKNTISRRQMSQNAVKLSKYSETTTKPGCFIGQFGLTSKCIFKKLPQKDELQKQIKNLSDIQQREREKHLVINCDQSEQSDLSMRNSKIKAVQTVDQTSSTSSYFNKSVIKIGGVPIAHFQSLSDLNSPFQNNAFMQSQMSSNTLEQSFDVISPSIPQETKKYPFLPSTHTASQQFHRSIIPSPFKKETKENNDTFQFLYSQKELQEEQENQIDVVDKCEIIKEESIKQRSPQTYKHARPKQIISSSILSRVQREEEDFSEMSSPMINIQKRIQDCNLNSPSPFGQSIGTDNPYVSRKNKIISSVFKVYNDDNSQENISPLLNVSNTELKQNVQENTSSHLDVSHNGTKQNSFQNASSHQDASHNGTKQNSFQNTSSHLDASHNGTKQNSFYNTSSQSIKNINEIKSNQYLKLPVLNDSPNTKDSSNENLLLEDICQGEVLGPIPSIKLLTQLNEGDREQPQLANEGDCEQLQQVMEGDCEQILVQKLNSETFLHENKDKVTEDLTENIEDNLIPKAETINIINAQQENSIILNEDGPKNEELLKQDDTDQDQVEFVIKKQIDFDQLKDIRDKTINKMNNKPNVQTLQSFQLNISKTVQSSSLKSPHKSHSKSIKQNQLPSKKELKLNLRGKRKQKEQKEEDQNKEEVLREQDKQIASKLDEIKDKLRTGVKLVIKEQIQKRIQSTLSQSFLQKVRKPTQIQKMGTIENAMTELEEAATTTATAVPTTLPSVAPLHQSNSLLSNKIQKQASMVAANPLGQRVNPSFDDQQREVQEYSSAVMNFFTSCVDNLSEKKSMMSHDFTLKTLKNFDANMSDNMMKTFEQELKRQNMSAEYIERFKYIYEINSKMHLFYQGLINTLGGIERVKDLIEKVVKKVSIHLTLLPLNHVYSFDALHRRIIPGVCALLCDDHALFKRTLNEFQKENEDFSFIDFYFIKKNLFSLLSKEVEVNHEHNQSNNEGQMNIQLVLSIMQKIESVRRYVFPLSLLSEPSIRDKIANSLFKCSNFISLFNKSFLLDKIRALLDCIFDYFYSDNDESVLLEFDHIRRLIQPYVLVKMSRKMFDYIELNTQQSLQVDRFTLNVILRDLHYKFTKLRLKFGFKQGIYGIFKFEDIQPLIDLIKEEVDNAISDGQTAQLEDYEIAQITNFSFLKNYLRFLLCEYDIFSVYDYSVAMPYFGVNLRIFQFWIRCLRTILLTQYRMHPTKINTFIRFIETCCPTH